MNITVKQLRAFVAVAESSSFAEACERVHLSQPALSIAIRKMEEAAGGRLFERTTRALALTPEGLAFLPVARRLLADWTEAFDDLHRLFATQRGKLSIAVMPSFAINRFPRALVRYRECHPRINITVHDIVMEQVIESVRSGRTDIGVTFEPESCEGVDFTPLFTDRQVAILPPGHAAGAKREVSWSMLARNPFIAMYRGSDYRRWTDAAMAAAGVQPHEIFEANQLATIARMVADGLGVAVVPELSSAHAAMIGAVVRPVRRPVIERRVGIFTRRRYPLSVAARRMKEILLEEFG